MIHDPRFTDPEAIQADETCPAFLPAVLALSAVFWLSVAMAGRLAGWW